MAKSYLKDCDMHTTLFLSILTGGFVWSYQEIVNQGKRVIPIIFLSYCKSEKSVGVIILIPLCSFKTKRSLSSVRIKLALPATAVAIM